MKNLGILAILLILATGVANAAFAFSFTNSDYSFSIYKGSSYVPVATPYSYVAYAGATPYYYFDYPYRVGLSGNYSYFQPGWYSFNTSGLAIAPDVVVSNYAIAPDVIGASYGYYQFSPNYYLNYNYYPSDYYYYGGAWNYYPSWVGTYGSTYYGSYFYPPSDNTLIGQTYHPGNEASCSEISFTTSTVSVSAGSKNKGTFQIENNSKKFLDVHSVSIIVDGTEATVSNVKYPSVLENGKNAQIEFDVTAGNLKEAKIVPAKMRLNGTFRDGTNCNSTDASFDLDISVAQSFNSEDFYPKKTSTTQGSYTYFVPKKTDDVWGTINNYFGNTSANGTNNTNANSTSNTNTTVAQFAAQPHITTQYGQDQPLARNCEALSIETKNFALDAGTSKSNYFILRNYNGEDFYLDSIDAKEYSPDFTLEAGSDSRVVYAAQTASFKVRANANDGASAGTGNGYVSIAGHYGSGLKCTLSSEPFFVTIAKENTPAGNVTLSVPAKSELKGNAGFVVFRLENNTSEDVQVLVSGDNVSVSDQSFIFKAHTIGERAIALNGLEGIGEITYTVVSDGKTINRQITQVTKVGEINAAAPVEQAQETVSATDKDTNNALPDLGNLGAGLFNLSRNGALLGVLVLIVILAIFVLLPRVNNKVIVN